MKALTMKITHVEESLEAELCSVARHEAAAFKTSPTVSALRDLQTRWRQLHHTEQALSRLAASDNISSVRRLYLASLVLELRGTRLAIRNSLAVVARKLGCAPRSAELLAAVEIQEEPAPPKAKQGKPRRGRRQQYNDTADRKLVADLQVSGLTVKEFARGRGISWKDIDRTKSRVRYRDRKRRNRDGKRRTK